MSKTTMVLLAVAAVGLYLWWKGKKTATTATTAVPAQASTKEATIQAMIAGESGSL